jgi:demethylmenaquinone methyltransferase/2-methoxy-6-polyprenyl-1,4-benzoquinol methylase
MIESEEPRRVPFGARDVDEREKPGLVRGVFDRVAGRYDLMNDLMSAGVHRLWKGALIDWLDPQPGQHLIDVAGGTGDVARAFLARAGAKAKRRGGAPAQAVICDINAAMLRAGQSAKDGIARVCGDAERLPFADGSAEACTIAFGIRNVTHIELALSEMFRVLKPGGRFICLEFSQVEIPGLDSLYEAYSDAVIPRLGKLVAGDAEPYRYLVESIRRFPDRARFAAMMSKAGFAQVRVRALSGGVAALHSGWRL